MPQPQPASFFSTVSLDPLARLPVASGVAVAPPAPALEPAAEDGDAVSDTASDDSHLDLLLQGSDSN